MNRTSAYNPRGKGQTETHNAIIWSLVTAALKLRNLPEVAMDPECWSRLF